MISDTTLKQFPQDTAAGFRLGLGDMEKNLIMIIFFLSVDIDIYHDINQITISVKLKGSLLLLSEM